MQRSIRTRLDPALTFLAVVVLGGVCGVIGGVLLAAVILFFGFLINGIGYVLGGPSPINWVTENAKPTMLWIGGVMGVLLPLLFGRILTTGGNEHEELED